MSNSRSEQFIAAALSSSADVCVIWPFAVRKSSGYGAHSLRRPAKKNIDVHRYVCSLAHGEPDVGMQAAHKCGNKLCINPGHLYWADAKTNMADAKAHGTLVGGGFYRQRLFEKEIHEIVTSGESLIALGERFGMEPAYIGKVRRKYSTVTANG